MIMTLGALDLLGVITRDLAITYGTTVFTVVVFLSAGVGLIMLIANGGNQSDNSNEPGPKF